MRAKMCLLWFLVVVAGCTSLGTFISENRQNLSRLNPGMTKDEIHAIMGQKIVRSYNNPYRTALYPASDGTRVDVFYYWTDGTAIDGISDKELTPVVFNNGRVVGWGREFWSEYVQKIELRIKSQ